MVHKYKQLLQKHDFWTLAGHSSTLYVQEIHPLEFIISNHSCLSNYWFTQTMLLLMIGHSTFLPFCARKYMWEKIYILGFIGKCLWSGLRCVGMAELGSRLLVRVLSLLYECLSGFLFSATFSFLVGLSVVLPLLWFSATFWTEDKLSAIELIVFFIFFAGWFARNCCLSLPSLWHPWSYWLTSLVGSCIIC